MLTACGATNTAADSSANAPAATAAPGTEGKHTVYPLKETDASGKEITIEKAPEKIVSTSPSETEILFALGLADRIVGVSDYDNYPKEVEGKAKVGGVVEPNTEAILAAQSDLVVSGISIKQTALDNLRSLGLTVICTNPKKLQDVLDDILLLGRITDKQTEAEALVARMNADIQKVKDAAATIKPEDKKKVYIEFSPGWTVGSGEFMDELITTAGGVNIASDVPGWNQINEEKIIKDNPDVIMYALNTTDEKGNKLEDLITGRSGWDQITAIKDKHVVGLEGDVISRPGPRITQALLNISNAIYPGLVK